MCVVASQPALPASAETSEDGADNAATAATPSATPLAAGCDAALWAIAGCSCGLAARIAVCQTSHALTASVDACRTLCELIALLACVFSTKYGEKGSSSKSRLYNSTYGLSRGAMVASLISRILFASFSLALFVAALQAVAAHAGHEGAPHAPLILLLAGSVFTFLALLRCMLRYTISRRTSHSLHPLLASAPADLISSLIVTSSALAAIFGGADVARLADPILTAAACILLVVFDYRELYSASLLLLQVSPHTNLPSQLKTSLNAIHGVQSFHELHAWQFTPSNHVVTAHIVYKSPSDYMKSKSLVMDVFIKYGFTHVTLQPEFKSLTDGTLNEEWCAWGSTCAVGDCRERRCCIQPIQPDISVVINKH